MEAETAAPAIYTIRNKEQLVERAKQHRELDEFAQGVYSHLVKHQFGPDAEVEFEGCAIGCLATPVDPRARYKLWVENAPEGQDSGAVEEIASDLIARLGSEFGICRSLARAAEQVFEGIRVYDEYGQRSREATRRRGADFVVEFAESVPEGVTITDDDVEMFCRSGNNGYWNSVDDLIPPYDDDDVDHSDRTVEGVAEAKRRALIGWLISLQPVVA